MKYIIFLLVTGCSTVEYSITVPIKQSNQEIGNVNFQSNQININYKYNTYLQLKGNQK